MNKMPIRSRIAVTARGFRLLKRYCPGLAQGKALQELIGSLQPFVTVWLTAEIINELSGQMRLRTVAAYTASMLLFQFFCSVARNSIRRVCDEKEKEMWKWFGKVFSDKQMALDFADLENAGVRRQRQEVEENLFMFGNGLAQLVWGTAGLVKAAVNILVSIVMIGPLFLARSGSAVMNSPFWIAAVLLCVLTGGLSNSRATVRENEIFLKWCEDTVWFNRTAEVFGKDLCTDQERAKDVRLYEQNFLAEKALERLLRAEQDSRAAHFRMSAYPAAAGTVIGLSNAACYLFVAVKAFFGAFGVGSIVQYVAVLQRLGTGLQELMFILSDNEVYCMYLQKMFDYLDIPEHRNAGIRSAGEAERQSCTVEFRDVSFRYPNTDKYALRHVNIRLQTGEKLAIVGQNGSGKTTFIKLLCRLYEPTEGEILLNGVNIREYDMEKYRSLFSVVFQDFRLFSFSLGQNVAAAANYDRERVTACLEMAGFGERLCAMPKGTDTCLYKNFEKDGVEISGGEAQKIALARALYRDAPFMILDEPTAALDPLAEYEVYSKFDELTGDRTAVYISHRLSSCRFCDRIAVFDDGQIVQKGSHGQLVADEEGKYYALWHAQAQYYTEQQR